MSQKHPFLRRHAARIVALLAILVAYWMTPLPRISADERSQFVSIFSLCI